MNVKLFQRDDSKWQADVILPDGRDFHAIGHEPGEALIELEIFWLSQPKPNDVSTLLKITFGETSK